MKWAIVVLAGLSLSALSGCCCCRQNYCAPSQYPYGATYSPQPVMQQPVYQQPCACY